MWVGSLPNARDAVTRVAFAPDGLTCAVGSGANKFCVFDLDV